MKFFFGIYLYRIQTASGVYIYMHSMMCDKECANWRVYSHLLFKFCYIRKKRGVHCRGYILYKSIYRYNVLLSGVP